MLRLITLCCALLCVAPINAQRQNVFGSPNSPFQSPPVQRIAEPRQTSSSSCPDKNGRYPVDGQCDAYLECIDGIAEDKLCPDGLLFNPDVSLFSYPCQYPIDVQCGARARLQPAEATEDCPHQFGYYRLGDASHCGQFMNCASGIGHVFDCPEGLAFNKETYRCDWADEVADCDAEAFLGFTCPPEARVEGLGFEETRFFRSPVALNCQRYFICQKGRPRMLSCGEGYAFNEITNACDDVENVTYCDDSIRAKSPNKRYRAAQLLEQQEKEQQALAGGSQQGAQQGFQPNYQQQAQAYTARPQTNQYTAASPQQSYQQPQSQQSGRGGFRY